VIGASVHDRVVVTEFTTDGVAMMNNRRVLLLTGTITTFSLLGCTDDERDRPRVDGPHPRTSTTEPVPPTPTHKTATQAKVAGAASGTAEPAPAGQPAGTAPSKTSQSNKVAGAPDDAATPAPREPGGAIPPEKSTSASGGKDATP
jgi:hypothetical protein